MVSRLNLHRPGHLPAIFNPVLLTALLTAAPIAIGSSCRVAMADSSGPRIIISGKAAHLSTTPYVDDDGNLYASVDFVHAMGADYKVGPNGRSVSIITGGRTTVWPCEMRAGQPVVVVSGVAQDLGGDFRWDEESQTATILAKIRMVREDHDQFSIATSFPVSYRVDSVASPDRVYVDVVGASLGAPETSVPVSGDDVAAVRANQMTPDTVRVVVDLKRPMTYQVANAVGASRVDVTLASADAGAPSPAVAHPAASMRIASATTAPAPWPQKMKADTDTEGAAGAMPAQSGGDDMTGASPTTATGQPGVDLSRPDATQHISNIEYDASTPGVLQVNVTLTGAGARPSAPYKAFLLENPMRLALDLPGADFKLSDDLASNSTCTLPLVNALVKSIRWGLLKSSSSAVSRVVLDLYRSTSYTVSSSPVDGGIRYTIDMLIDGRATPPAAAPGAVQPLALTPPASVANQRYQPVITAPSEEIPSSVLNGKTVVVDAGHGGHDGGAPGVDGLWEKDINLSIARSLRDQLVASGVRVIMTRSDDTFIPLPDRAAMGVDGHADYFVSVHADSSGTRNSHDGASVYYHANVRGCRALAESIAGRLSQLNDGIRTLGVRSDYVRFPGVGYSVLRNSPETAVLVETGYVNSDHDASILTNTAMQKLIASGIVAGLKDFVYHLAGAPRVQSASSR